MGKALAELFGGFREKTITVFLINGDKVAGRVTAVQEDLVALAYTRPATPANPRTGIPAVEEKTFTQWVPFGAIAKVVTSESDQ